MNENQYTQVNLVRKHFKTKYESLRGEVRNCHNDQVFSLVEEIGNTAVQLMKLGVFIRKTESGGTRILCNHYGIGKHVQIDLIFIEDIA